MQAQLRDRLETLRTEFESGQKVLAELEAKRESLKETLLRISGAIQVLEEVLADAESGDPHTNQRLEAEPVTIPPA